MKRSKAIIFFKKKRILTSPFSAMFILFLDYNFKKIEDRIWRTHQNENSLDRAVLSSII